MRHCTINKCDAGHWGPEIANGQTYIKFWEPCEISFTNGQKSLIFVDEKIKISKAHALRDIKFNVTFKTKYNT